MTQITGAPVTMYATGTASVTLPHGEQILIRHGTHWPADDPVVLQHPGLFSTDPRFGMSYSRPQPPEPPIEQATAAPGERRVLSRADASAEELERLRAEAKERGIAVDGRWSIARLREEIAATRG